MAVIASLVEMFVGWIQMYKVTITVYKFYCAYMVIACYKIGAPIDK